MLKCFGTFELERLASVQILVNCYITRAQTRYFRFFIGEIKKIIENGKWGIGVSVESIIQR